MIEPLKPPSQVSHSLPGRSLHEERKRTSDTYVAVSKLKSQLKRRKAERRKLERRSAERRMGERRSTNRRASLRSTPDRRIKDRRQGDRRQGDRRTLDRRALGSTDETSGSAGSVKRRSGSGIKRSIKIDEYV